jgi:hypothetical protein
MPMVRTILPLLVVAAGGFLSSHQSIAGPLTSAEVTKIINRVSVIDPAKGGHAASIREVIKDDLGLQTGEKSRSELLFQDNTLTRIGAETFFSFKTGTRDMTLEKGSMLLQVPKGLGGAKIHTAAVTAAITGTTIMMEYVPDRYIKVLVLEGSLRLSRNGRFGDSLVLRPGKMVIMRPDAKKIPEPIDVDLEQIVKTSTLVNFPEDKAPLPSMPLIQAAISDQTKQLVKKDLVPTNLVMGHGTNVALALNNPLAMPSPSSILGATLNAGIATGKNGTLSLSVVGNVAPTLGSATNATTTTLSNLLSSTTGTVSGVANNLLGGVSTVASIPVSSSTQLISLLNTAVPNATGIIMIVPTGANAGAIVAAVPTGIVPSDSISNNVSTTVANTTGTITSAVPLSGTSAATSGTVPLLSSSSTISSNPVLSTVASAPTTVTGTLVTQSSKPNPLPLGLGH